MSVQKHTRASKRLEQVRLAWGLTGAQIADELAVRQPSVSRILGGLLLPGRDLSARMQVLFMVPVTWWLEAPLAVEQEPVPEKPSRYAEPHPKTGTDEG